MQTDLPEPSADARAASEALTRVIAAEIVAGGGWMSFARYMELALYAPELTPLFGQALARQVAQILAASRPLVIEVGAGSGRLAADLLPALDALGCAPERYRILELSGELRARQKATLVEHAPRFVDRVEWLEQLPERFSGCLVANEVLDAMPTHSLRWDDATPVAGVFEQGVGLIEGRPGWTERPASGDVLAAAEALPVRGPYRGEINRAAQLWVGELSRRLEQGALLLIDYGLPRRELYHPQRDGGTLRCHYRHRMHEDPFWLPGLSDLTTHVDFTAVAEAGFDAGLDVLGYTSQASFLINCGIGPLLDARVGAGDTAASSAASAGELRARGAANVLISPNEMGELFKVIALGRGVPGPLLGFARGDRVHAL